MRVHGLANLPAGIKTYADAKNDPELNRIKRGKNLQIYAFKMVGKCVRIPHFIANTYDKQYSNKRPKRWSGKIYFKKNIFSKISLGKCFFEKNINEKIILEYIKFNLSRILGGGNFEAPKARLARLPIISKELIKKCGDKCVIENSLRLMIKLNFPIRQIINLTTTDGNSQIKIPDYIKKYQSIPENVLSVPENILCNDINNNKIKLKAIMSLLATSTSIGNAFSMYTSFFHEKDRNNKTVCLRVVDRHPSGAFEYHEMKTGEDPRDICTRVRQGDLFIKWDNLSRSQKDEFLEVKRYHLELIKDKKLLEYIFFRDGRFEVSETECLTKETADHYMNLFIKHVEEQGKIYAKDLEEYEKRRGETFRAQGNEEYLRGDSDRALIYYKKDLEVILSRHGNDHYETGNSYTLIAIAETERGNYKEAEGAFLKGLSILRGTLPKNHPYIAKNLNRLGNLYEKEKNYEQAQKCYEEALEILKESLPEEENLLFAITYNNLSSICYHNNLFEKCIEYANKSYTTLKKILPEDNDSVAIVANNLGMAYSKLEKYREAKEVYKKSLEILKKHSWEYSPSLAIAQKKLGDTYFKLEKYHKAWGY